MFYFTAVKMITNIGAVKMITNYAGYVSNAPTTDQLTLWPIGYGKYIYLLHSITKTIN